MNNVLIIGGAGFIGSSLCEFLVKKCKVVCIDNLMRGKKDNINHLVTDDNFQFIQCDANNVDLLKKLF